MTVLHVLQNLLSELINKNAHGVKTQSPGKPTVDDWRWSDLNFMKSNVLIVYFMYLSFEEDTLSPSTPTPPPTHIVRLSHPAGTDNRTR